MHLLLDENLPHDLAALLVGHHVETVAGRGWSGIENGALLALVEDAFEVFATMDRRLPQQQDLSQFSFGVLLIQARSNRMVHLKPLVAEILGALRRVRPGVVSSVGA